MDCGGINMTSADLRLIQDINNIMNNGEIDENPRPKYEDGTPAFSKFTTHVVRTYRLNKGEFPICTLRPIAWKSAIKEVLWIYQDQSNSLDVLEDKYDIHWWNEWESKDIPRTIGVRYGETVRRHDLVNKLLDDIKNDPYGRRHIMSLWQEDDFKASDGLRPCAYETIWTVRGNYLDMILVQRSGDMLTASGAGGVNEVQYAALLMMIAKATGYEPGKFTHLVVNEHIYDRHYDAAKELISRCESLKTNDNTYTYQFDKVIMNFSPSSDNFYEFSIDDFSLINYNPKKPQIKLELGI